MPWFLVDEKGQVQALDRTHPSLPLYPGRLGTTTYDYERQGSTTLFAAQNMANGKIVAQCMPRHRHQEWIKFLKLIDQSTEPTLELHLIADDYAAHEHPKVKAWLKSHPRFHMHFTPTSSSWLNMVERWFREATTKRIRRGSFRNVPELINVIMEYVEHHNQTAKPFVWKAKTETILRKCRRAKRAPAARSALKQPRYGDPPNWWLATELSRPLSCRRRCGDHDPSLDRLRGR